jgi:hypothetical protein
LAQLFLKKLGAGSVCDEEPGRKLDKQTMKQGSHWPNVVLMHAAHAAVSAHAANIPPAIPYFILAGGR